jgi:hypothetical protein
MWTQYLEAVVDQELQLWWSFCEDSQSGRTIPGMAGVVLTAAIAKMLLFLLVNLIAIAG